MLFKIIKIGKPAFSEYEPLVAVYESRIEKFVRFERKLIKTSNKDKIPKEKNQILVCLDETGKEWSSPELSKQIGKWQDDARVKEVCFLIGGPYGLDAETKKAADHCWSLSKATLPSDMAWLLATEQIYRAFTILKGTGYHH